MGKYVLKSIVPSFENKNLNKIKYQIFLVQQPYLNVAYQVLIYVSGLKNLLERWGTSISIHEVLV